MKINCGPTPLERESALQQWHRWFAWKPVRVGPRDCRWLETVERRRELLSGGFYSLFRFEYRAVPK